MNCVRPLPHSLHVCKSLRVSLQKHIPSVAEAQDWVRPLPYLWSANRCVFLHSSTSRPLLKPRIGCDPFLIPGPRIVACFIMTPHHVRRIGCETFLVRLSCPRIIASFYVPSTDCCMIRFVWTQSLPQPCVPSTNRCEFLHTANDLSRVLFRRRATPLQNVHGCRQCSRFRGANAVAARKNALADELRTVCFARYQTAV